MSFTTVKDIVLAGGNQNSEATEVALNSINIFPLARHGHWLSLSYHPLSSLSISLSTWPVHMSQSTLSPSLPPLPPPPILSFLSGYPVIAEAQCDPGLNTHPTQTLHPHTCPTGLCEGQETATYTQSSPHKVKLKRTQNCGFANSVNPAIINLVKKLNFVFCSVVFMNESSVCADQRVKALWWNRKSESFCKAISHMIGTVPSLALITTPGRLIICFCPCAA